ncbi:acyl-CoA dehydrogenase family protein [Halalkalicoccus subterraneus]|uniref:acyl-CoA dehydrogenase family protein n=1 Tax=Halalkalicoccus subterraneus TaxID=2675002 RepID=UPI000EFC4F86|nr:acyl-CoA dehydrogenase family protein [Halalkalicoccus subterraneus]
MLDYVGLEDELDDEARSFRDSAREFVDEYVRPGIAEHYEAGTFPEEVIPEMGERGFFATNLDGYGLPDASETAYGLVMQELEACDSGLRSMASVQGALAMYPIHAFGSEDQKDEWLPPMGNGEAVGGFALTEPDHGSDAGSMETRAERDGEEFVLNGEKRWCTNSPIADVLVVWARDASSEDEPVRGFLVETDRDGLEIEAIDGKLSLRASSSGEFTMENVRVPDENVLPGVEGMKGPLSCLTQARYGIAWGAVGAARDCFEEARAYATDREQFDKPIGGFQLQQEKLAEMATEITTSQLLAHRLAELKERGDMRPQHVSMAKRNNVEMARDQSRIAREMLGGNGITDEYSPMRHMANMETVYTYEGTHDIHTLILGQDLTGIAAFE